MAQNCGPSATERNKLLICPTTQLDLKTPHERSQKQNTICYMTLFILHSGKHKIILTVGGSEVARSRRWEAGNDWKRAPEAMEMQHVLIVGATQLCAFARTHPSIHFKQIHLILSKPRKADWLGSFQPLLLPTAPAQGSDLHEVGLLGVCASLASTQ